MREEKFASCTLSDFLELKELYRSSTGTVYRAKFKYDNKIYVLKERKVAELGRRKDIMNEVKLLLQLRHQNIVQCEGWFRDVSNSHILYIVLEYCSGGDLNSIIETRKRQKFSFEEKDVWLIFYHVCCGVRHLHENGIVHRDIKALNILMHRQLVGNSSSNFMRPIFKVSDLGVSRQVSERTVMLNTFYGTPLYLSPEIVDNKPYNEKTDIWSLGVLLYEICALSPPFTGRSLGQVTKSIQSGVYDTEPLSRYSKDISKCIRWMLQKEYANRPNIVQLLEMVTSKLVTGYQGETLLGAASQIFPEPVFASNNVSSMPHVLKEEGNDKSDDEELMDNDSLDGESSPEMNHVSYIVEPIPRKQSPARIKSVEKSAEDEMRIVCIDVMRCHMKHRKESNRYRKLLQVRDYFSSGQGGDSGETNSLNVQIQEVKASVKILEEGIAKGVLPHYNAKRLDVLQQPKLIPSQTNLEPKENSFIVHDDTLPVYLQPPPRRQSPPTRRPHHPAAGFAQVYTEAIHILPSKEPKMIHHFQDKNSGKQNLESKEVEEGRASKVEQRKPSITFAVNVHTDKIDENIRPQNKSSIRRLEKAVAYGKNSSNIVSSDNGLVLPSMEEAFTVVDKRGNSCRPRPKSAVVTRRSNAKEIHVDVKLVSDEQHRNQHAPLIYEEVQPRPTTAFPAKHVHSDEQDVPTILSDKERIYHHQRAFSDITDLKKVSDADTSEVPYCNKEKVSIPSKSEVPRQYRHKKTDITPSEQATQLGYAAVYQKAKNNHHFQFGEVRKKDTIVQLRQQKDYNIITGEY